MLPPEAYPTCASAGLTTRLVHAALNRTRCSLNAATFTPDGRRCIVGDNVGMYNAWNSADFNFMQQYQVTGGCVVWARVLGHLHASKRSACRLLCSENAALYPHTHPPTHQPTNQSTNPTN
jgi:hypothetical protein